MAQMALTAKCSKISTEKNSLTNVVMRLEHFPNAWKKADMLIFHKLKIRSIRQNTKESS